jgi:hypothetical protein
MEVPKIGMALIDVTSHFTAVMTRQLQSLMVGLRWPMVIRALVVPFGAIFLSTNNCGCGAWGRERARQHELLNTAVLFTQRAFRWLCQYLVASTLFSPYIVSTYSCLPRHSLTSTTRDTPLCHAHAPPPFHYH